MKEIFRFRPFDLYSIEDLINDSVSGTLASEMKDKNEMAAYINEENLLKNTSLDETQRKRIINLLQRHCINTYFISSFTSYINNKMWDEYANNGNGFCMVYNINDIINAYRTEIILTNNPKYLFRSCNYSESLKIDISKFTNDMEIILRKFTSKNDIENAVKKHIYNDDWKFFTEILFHKTGKFVEKNEYRLITKRQINSNVPYDKVLKVKPKKIIISNKLDKLIIKYIEQICMNKYIDIEYYNY